MTCDYMSILFHYSIIYYALIYQYSLCIPHMNSSVLCSHVWLTSSDVECLVHTRSSFLSHLVAVWGAPDIITVPAVVSCMCVYVCVYISSTHCISTYHMCAVLYLVSIIHVQHETDMRTIVCFLVTSLIFSVL